MFKTINGGKLPTKGSKYSACVDLYANEDISINAGDTAIVGLGVVIDLDSLLKSIPSNRELSFQESHYIQLAPRSSLRAKGLISGQGYIDIDYVDEVKLIVSNPIRRYSVCGFYGAGDKPSFKIRKGDRIAQAMLCEHKSYLFGIETDDERTGGIGSTNITSQS